MSKITRTHRPLTQRNRFTSTSPLVQTPQSYLLFFEDTGERIIAKKSSIKRIVDDYATVKIDSKERTTEIEAHGLFLN